MNDSQAAAENNAIRLAQLLRSERSRNGFTLRDVEKITDGEVSNAYLSQLENGKIAKPSPHILYALSEALGVPYDQLMERAGYISGGDKRKDGEKHGRAATFSIDNLSNEEERELRDYLNFIRMKQQK